jgi:hypothetical protein
VTTTPDLIDALVECAAPVRRLRPPLLRALVWLGFAGIVLVLLAVAHGVRADLAERLLAPTFALGIAAALATGILAAIAAFALSLPDRSRWWALLPAPALAAWVSTIGYGCLTDWVSVSPDGVTFGETARCFATLVLTSVPLSIAMLVMLRYAALLRPDAVVGIGALAVAAITSAALSLLHDLDATAMILIWNLGTAALITALGSLFGRGLFEAVASRLPAHRPPSRIPSVPS